MSVCTDPRHPEMDLKIRQLELQIDELRRTADNNAAKRALLTQELAESNRLNDGLKKFALEKVREMHNVWGHPGDFMSCAHGGCPSNVKAMAGFMEKRKCVKCGAETGPGDPRCMQCIYEAGK